MATRLISIDDITDPDIIRNRDIARGFIGSVKVIGSMGGNSTYDTFYSIGPKINVSLFTDRINQIRKNVALLTRNLLPVYENTSTPNNPEIIDNKIFIINQSNTTETLTYSRGIDAKFRPPTPTVQSLIIIGYDLIIDADIINTDIIAKKPKGIIVLKNKNGKGGNIIITNAVKNIQSSLVAE